MAVQFNLLPDVKYEFLKAKRLQRLITVISAIAVGVSLTVLVFLLLYVYIFRPHHINDLTADIKTNTAKIQKIDGLNTILTVQNQLKTLPGLYAKNPKSSRIFKYITQLTPPDVTIGDLSLDFGQNTMIIKGDAQDLKSINAYTDTLKSATYDDKTTGDKDVQAFNGVTLASFGRTDKGANYTINLTFDPLLFDASKEVKLHVPNTTNLPKVPGGTGKLFKSTEENK